MVVTGESARVRLLAADLVHRPLGPHELRRIDAVPRLLRANAIAHQFAEIVVGANPYGSLTTTGQNAAGFQSFIFNGSMTIDVGTISTSGDDSPAVFATAYGADTTIKAGQITTAGSNSSGIAPARSVV